MSIKSALKFIKYLKFVIIYIEDNLSNFHIHFRRIHNNNDNKEVDSRFYDVFIKYVINI